MHVGAACATSGTASTTCIGDDMTHIRTVHRTRTCARYHFALLAAVAATARALTAQDAG